MIDELMRELRRLQGGQRVPVTVAVDADGYLDRECPSSERQFAFKVHNEDWRDKARQQTTILRAWRCSTPGTGNSNRPDRKDALCASDAALSVGNPLLAISRDQK